MCFLPFLNFTGRGIDAEKELERGAPNGFSASRVRFRGIGGSPGSVRTQAGAKACNQRNIATDRGRI